MTSPASTIDVVNQLTKIIAELTQARDALKISSPTTPDPTGVPVGTDGKHDPNALLRLGLGHRTAS